MGCYGYWFQNSIVAHEMTKGAVKNILNYFSLTRVHTSFIIRFWWIASGLHLKPQKLFLALISNILFLLNYIHRLLSFSLLYKVLSQIFLDGFCSAAYDQKFGFGVSSRSTCRLVGWWQVHWQRSGTEQDSKFTCFGCSWLHSGERYDSEAMVLSSYLVMLQHTII